MGETSLLFGLRVPKTDPRVNAYGTIDELNAVMGVARASSTDNATVQTLEAIQQVLFQLSAELACPEDKLPRLAAKRPLLGDAELSFLDQQVLDLESRGNVFAGFVVPGATLPSAHLHHARTLARRAERDVLLIREAGLPVRDAVLSYLNRLSDVLWLLARLDEVWNG